MPNNIRVVFWDIDGTMVMSESLHEATPYDLGSPAGVGQGRRQRHEGHLLEAGFA
jgi:hypothetical protein